MTEQNTDREFTWDDEIEKDSDFILLDPGDYDFTVVNFERKRFEGSDKLPPCPMAVVQLQIKTTQGPASIFHRLYLHSRSEWGLSLFFSSIGQKKKGEKLKMDWNAVPGSTGRAKIGIRSWDGKDYNEVKQFYSKENGTAHDAASPQGARSWGV